MIPSPRHRARQIALHLGPAASSSPSHHNQVDHPMTSTKAKVAVLGAGGGIGQPPILILGFHFVSPVSLLLKQSHALTELALFDVVPVVFGVAADISHVNTPSVVTGYTKDNDGLAKALTGCDIVVIPAGVPRKPGMTRDDLFKFMSTIKINASIVRDLATGVAQHCPKAFVCVISNPVNSTVPICAQVFKQAGTFDPKRLFGVTTLDIVRASTFVTAALGIPTEAPKYSIPVVGGHSGATIVPLLSQATPKIDSKLLNDQEALEKVINRIQFGGDEVVKAKDGAGSATLSMAYAGFRFVESLIKAKYEGKSGVIEDTYIHISAHPSAAKALSGLTKDTEGIEFFSLPVELGPDGVKDVHVLGQVTPHEQKLLAACVGELKGNIEKSPLPGTHVPDGRSAAMDDAEGGHLVGGRSLHPGGRASDVQLGRPPRHPRQYEEDAEPVPELDDDGVRERIRVPDAAGHLTGYAVPGYRPPPAVPANEVPGGLQEGAEGIQGSHGDPGPAKGTDEARKLRMNPHLQLQCGPMLRYDTVHDGIYHAFALIVTADGGSDYSTRPHLTYRCTPTASLEASFQQHATLNGNGAAHSRASSGEQVVLVEASKIWIFHSLTGANSFWRFKLEIKLGSSEMPVHYSVNGGPEIVFYVPGTNENFRWAGHSCNGFSAGVDTEKYNGPDPLWNDVLKRHAQRPLHALVGGGDQIYCDAMAKEPELVGWMAEKDVHLKQSGKIAPPLSSEAHIISLFDVSGFRTSYAGDPLWHRPLCTTLPPALIIALLAFGLIGKAPLQLFNHYTKWFRNGAFGRAIACIPMLNMLDDHDLIDGFGSYPEELQTSPIFSHIGSRGVFFYQLFQLFIVDEYDGTGVSDVPHSNLSIIQGGPGPYVPFNNHSFLTWLGPDVRMLLLDCRTERKRSQVVSDFTYTNVFAALRALPSTVKHLVILLGIPILYPRMVFAEDKLNPLVLLGKSGVAGFTGLVNRFNKDAELLDDLNVSVRISVHQAFNGIEIAYGCRITGKQHAQTPSRSNPFLISSSASCRTAKTHKAERNWLIVECRQLATERRMRITFLSGDVHLAAVGRIFDKRGVPPERDPSYMLNIVSSAIVNKPPPTAIVGLQGKLNNKRHKTLHHENIDENMLELFVHDTDGKKLKNPCFMGRRNYCMAQVVEGCELQFDMRIEIAQGVGETKGYPLQIPPPAW
ncbi:MAG: hypothetical protein CYPHOPRED_001655 [Cyphobasidiales sp. Tagirdzhanova-0007]|nr:MAG: hypothetical protein CYPHOPRED_001655 [Cyphobasidiales sp. Tagirdzhanova-0007]